MANGLPPQTSEHLSDLSRSEMIEHYGGVVDGSFAYSSIMRQFTNVQSVRGTDTLINRRVGATKLQALKDGVRPDAHRTKFGRVALTVDTTVIARDNRSQLNEFQTDFNARAEIGREHGIQIAKYFDESLLIQAIKTAQQPAPVELDGSIGAGHVQVLDAIGAENDPDLLYDAIAKIIVAKQENDIDTSRDVIFIRPTAHKVLLDNEKLVDRDYSTGNGDFAKGVVKSILNVPIISTARIPTQPIDSHLLGADYNINALQASAVAVIVAPESLLVGETIPLTSDVWFDKKERQWFIDSFIAYGAAPRRPDVTGVVFKAQP